MTRATQSKYEERNNRIARSFSLWGEYVDPDATMSESEFDALGIDERMELMAEAFPECDDVDVDNCEADASTVKRTGK